jgi:hypothetical protein
MTTIVWPHGVAYAARPLPTDMPTSAMPSGTSSTNRRANRTPACLLDPTVRRQCPRRRNHDPGADHRMEIRWRTKP